MEREISAVTWLAVSLISLSIVISIVMMTVFIGNKTKNEAIEYAVDLADAMESGEMKGIRDLSTDLPMVSIYSLMTRNSGSISAVTIYDCSAVDNSILETRINEFVDNEDKLGTNPLDYGTTFKANSKGLWTVDGGESGGLVSNYEVLRDCNGRNLLNGRGYMVANKLQNGTYRVSILKYQ